MFWPKSELASATNVNPDGCLAAFVKGAIAGGLLGLILVGAVSWAGASSGSSYSPFHEMSLSIVGARRGTLLAPRTDGPISELAPVGSRSWGASRTAPKEEPVRAQTETGVSPSPGVVAISRRRDRSPTSTAVRVISNCSSGKVTPGGPGRSREHGERPCPPHRVDEVGRATWPLFDGRI